MDSNMSMTFEVKNGKHGSVARLTVAVLEVERSRLEQRLARQLGAQCAERGFAVRGTINIEIQANCLAATVDVTAAAFVVGTGASTTKRPASSATAASRPPRVRTSRGL
jgi:hypothetical protein